MSWAACLVFLVPGALSAGGGGSSFWISSEEYFAEYRAFFESKGCRVKQGEFPPDATIEERALVLKDQVQRFAQGGQVALVAHSQGGLDARFAIKTLGLEGVRGLVSIGTPHGGTPLADWVVDHRERGSALYWVLRLLGGYDLRALRFAGELAPGFLERHRERFGPAEGVRYASARGICRQSCHLTLGWLAGWAGVGEGDGLIPAESQRFGEDLGEFDLDHLSEVGRDGKKGPERARFLAKAWEFLAR